MKEPRRGPVAIEAQTQSPVGRLPREHLFGHRAGEHVRRFPGARVLNFDEAERDHRRHGFADGRRLKRGLRCDGMGRARLPHAITTRPFDDSVIDNGHTHAGRFVKAHPLLEAEPLA